VTVTTAADLRSRAGTARSVVHARICAAVTAASCLAHSWLVAGNQHGTWLNLLMLAMVAVCLPCAVHIWRQRRARALRQVMAAALAMAGVHAVLLLGAGSGAGGTAHLHHGAAAAANEAAGASGAGALLAVMALEFTTALLAATLLARLRAHPGA
jgi:Kef-type K+ transport system membrane component KefB